MPFGNPNPSIAKQTPNTFSQDLWDKGLAWPGLLISCPTSDTVHFLSVLSTKTSLAAQQEDRAEAQS